MRRQENYLAGAAAGIVAGLVAAYLMEKAQDKLQPLLPKADKQGTPSTEKAADAVAESVSGKPLSEPAKKSAGRLVHYATGAALGLVYGVLAERFQAITSGFGLSFGTGVAVGVDETLVPALGLAPPITKTSPTQHLYSIASHMVFGVGLEGTRRLLRGG